MRCKFEFKYLISVKEYKYNRKKKCIKYEICRDVIKKLEVKLCIVWKNGS